MKSYCKTDLKVQKELNFKMFIILSICLIVGSIGLVLYIVLSGFIFKNDPKWLNIMLWTSAFLFVYGLVFLIVSSNTDKKVTKQNLADECEFFEDHLMVKSFKKDEEVGNSKIYYKDVAKVKETKSYIFISAFQALPINKSDFSSDQIAEIKSKIVNAKNLKTSN